MLVRLKWYCGKANTLRVAAFCGEMIMTGECNLHHGSCGQGKSEKIREFKNIRVQKLTKMQKKFELLYITVKKFSCLLRLHFMCASTFKFVAPPLFLVRLQAIEN